MKSIIYIIIRSYFLINIRYLDKLVEICFSAEVVCNQPNFNYNCKVSPNHLFGYETIAWYIVKSQELCRPLWGMLDNNNCPENVILPETKTECEYLCREYINCYCHFFSKFSFFFFARALRMDRFWRYLRDLTSGNENKKYQHLIMILTTHSSYKKLSYFVF